MFKFDSEAMCLRFEDNKGRFNIYPFLLSKEEKRELEDFPGALPVLLWEVVDLQNYYAKLKEKHIYQKVLNIDLAISREHDKHSKIGEEEVICAEWCVKHLEEYPFLERIFRDTSYNFLNVLYIKAIEKELIECYDFIPPCFIRYIDNKERANWLKENDYGHSIHDEMKEYRHHMHSLISFDENYAQAHFEELEYIQYWALELHPEYQRVIFNDVLEEEMEEIKSRL